MRFFNPVDMLSSGGPERQLPSGSSGARSRRASPIRATHATERARRLIRKIAVSIFGRGKTQLDYRHAHWFVHVYGPDGYIAASFVAVDRSPGAFGTGIDLIPAP